MWRRDDGGGTWGDARAVGGRSEAFANAGDRLLIATGGGISQSLDNGAVWTDLHREH